MDIILSKWNEDKIVNKFTLNHGGVNDVIVRSDERIFVTAGWDHRVRVFDLKKQRLLGILKYHEDGVMTIAFNRNDENLLASCSKDQRIALWKLDLKKKKK